MALELLRRRVADDTERRLAGDVLSPRWWPASSSGAELARRLEPFGLRDARRRARARPAAQRPRPPPRRRSRARCARRRAAAWSRRPRRRSCARCCRRAATTSCSRSASGCARRVARETGEPLSGRRRPDGRRRRPAPRLPRGALRARGAGAGASTATAAPGALATYRDLGSFQLLLSLQDDDALRLFCDSILAPIEDSEGAYGGELMRSLEAFIECNGQWERAARAALLSPSHAALPDPARRGADRAFAGLRARPHRLLARPAWARAGPPVKETERHVKVGVPTEIKTDEYRVALTPAGVRELVEHGHEVVIQAGAGEGSAIADSDYVSQGARILPDAEAVFARGGHDRQGQGAAGGRGRRCSSRATRCSPTCTWRRIPS